MAGGNLLYEHRELNPGLSDYLEGWKGMADVREIQEGGVVRIPIVDSCYVWQRPTQYCKVIIFQLETNKFFKILEK